jgi:hypothetical protein
MAAYGKDGSYELRVFRMAIGSSSLLTNSHGQLVLNIYNCYISTNHWPTGLHERDTVYFLGGRNRVFKYEICVEESRALNV